MAYTTIPASTGGGSAVCVQTLISTQTIAGADTNTVTFSGLNGNADYIYEVDGWGPCGVGCTSRGGVAVLKFNATNTSASAASFPLGSAAGNVTWVGNTVGLVVYEVLAGRTFAFGMRIYAQTGVNRMVKWWCMGEGTASTNDNFYMSGMDAWQDSVTNITSMSFVDGTHNLFGIGSVITLRKIAIA